MLLHLGPGTLMAKIDIASAYRIIPVHPQDRYLLGMSFDKKVPNFLLAYLLLQFCLMLMRMAWSE